MHQLNEMFQYLFTNFFTTNLINVLIILSSTIVLLSKIKMVLLKVITIQYRNRISPIPT